MSERGEPPELLTTIEVARLFRVARSTVISWAYRGLLPHTTTPTGHLRFHRETIEQMLAERGRPSQGRLGDQPRRHDPEA